MSQAAKRKESRHLRLVVDNTTQPVVPKLEVLSSQVLMAVRALSKPGEADYLTQLIQRFVATTPDLLGKIEASLLIGNAQGAVALLQYAKGSAHNLGAMELAALVGRLEVDVQGNHLKSALLLFPEVTEAFNRASDALKAWVVAKTA